MAFLNKHYETASDVKNALLSGEKITCYDIIDGKKIEISKGFILLSGPTKDRYVWSGRGQIIDGYLAIKNLIIVDFYRDNIKYFLPNNL